MIQLNVINPDPVFESLSLRTPAQVAKVKKGRDERRKSIKNQNARSKMK